MNFIFVKKINKFNKNNYSKHEFEKYSYSIHEIKGQYTTTNQNGIEVCCHRGCYKEYRKNIKESNDFQVNDNFYFWNTINLYQAYYCLIDINYNNNVVYIKHGKFCHILKKYFFFKEKSMLFYWKNVILK